MLRESGLLFWLPCSGTERVKSRFHKDHTKRDENSL